MNRHIKRRSPSNRPIIDPWTIRAVTLLLIFMMVAVLVSTVGPSVQIVQEGDQMRTRIVGVQGLP